MPGFLYEGSVTAPPATPASAPVTATLGLTDGVLDTLEVLIPRGHVGLTGLAIDLAGTQVVPWSPARWLIGDNDLLHYDIGLDCTLSGLSLVAYNTGALVHTFYVRATATPHGVGVSTGTLDIPALALPPVAIPA